MSTQLTKQARKHQALLNTLLENVTTVQAQFADHHKLYTYKVPTHWGIKAGDGLVVDSPNSGMTVAKVVSVDAVPAFDAVADFAYKWAVQKVDRSGYDAQQKREALFLEQMAVVERLSARADTLNKVQTVLADKPEASQAFKDAMAVLNGVVGLAQAEGTAEATTAQ
jgi:hypothetical protein